MTLIARLTAGKDYTLMSIAPRSLIDPIVVRKTVSLSAIYLYICGDVLKVNLTEGQAPFIRMDGENDGLMQLQPEVKGILIDENVEALVSFRHGFVELIRAFGFELRFDFALKGSIVLETADIKVSSHGDDHYDITNFEVKNAEQYQAVMIQITEAMKAARIVGYDLALSDLQT